MYTEIRDMVIEVTGSYVTEKVIYVYTCTFILKRNVSREQLSMTPFLSIQI